MRPAWEGDQEGRGAFEVDRYEQESQGTDDLAAS